MVITTVPTREDLYQEFFPKNAVGAELGVYNGANAVQLYRRTTPSHLYLVDPYSKPHSMDEPETSERIARLLLPYDNVTFVKQLDWDWLPTLPPGHLQWVYLDTTHFRQNTTRELPLIIEQLGRGGILAGHDFVISPAFMAGVVAPVLECVQNGQIRIIALS